MIAGRIVGEGVDNGETGHRSSALSDAVLSLKPGYEQMDSGSAKARYIAAAFYFH